MRRRVRILLHCDDRRRDSVTMSMLAFCLKGMGHDVRLCNRVTLRKYDPVFDPDLIVLSHSFMYGGGPDDLARKARRAKILILPTEGAILGRGQGLTSYSGQPIDAPRENRQALTRYVSKIFVWGDATRRFLIEEGIYQDHQVMVVGCPRFDLYRSPLFREIRLRNVSARRVGVVGVFQAINIFDQRNHLLTIDQLRHSQRIYYDEDKNLEDYFWWQYANFRLTLDLVEEAILRRGMSVYYRPHPNEHINSYQFLQARLGSSFRLERGDTPFFSWLAQVPALVITNSTTAVEAFITSTPAISLQSMLGESLDRHMNLPDWCHPMLQYCRNPKSVGEAVDLIEMAVAGNLEPTDINIPSVAQFLRDFYDWPRVELSMVSVVREIDRMAREELGGQTSRNVLDPYRVGTGAVLLLMNAFMFFWYGVRGGSVHRHSHFYPWHQADIKLASQLYRQLTPRIGELVTQ